MAHKPDHCSFKFTDKSLEMRGLKVDERNGLELSRQKGHGVVRNQPGVNSLMAWEEPLHGSQCDAGPIESEGSKGRRKICTEKNVVDTYMPEIMVASFQDSNYNFVEDIFIHREVQSENECMVENCDLDHRIISLMLNSDMETSSESTIEALKIGPSFLNESKLMAEHDCTNDVAKQCSSEKLMAKGAQNFGGQDDEEIYHSPGKIAHSIQQVKEVQSEEAVVTNSVVLSPIESVACSYPTNESFLECEAATNISTESSVKGAICQQGLGTRSMSGPEPAMSESRTSPSPSPSFVMQHGHEVCSSLSDDPPEGPIEYSGPVPYCGSISLRSIGTTASSHSFAFPILHSEWTDSPVRKASPEQRQLQRHQRWRMYFLCCKF